MSRRCQPGGLLRFPGIAHAHLSERFGYSSEGLWFQILSRQLEQGVGELGAGDNQHGHLSDAELADGAVFFDSERAAAFQTETRRVRRLPVEASCDFLVETDGVTQIKDRAAGRTPRSIKRRQSRDAHDRQI